MQRCIIETSLLERNAVQMQHHQLTLRNVGIRFYMDHQQINKEAEDNVCTS